MSRRSLVLFAFLLLALDAGASMAQSRQRGTMTRGVSPQMNHRFEIIPFGGYAWTFSRRVTLDFGAGDYRTGDIDIKDSGFWGIEGAFNLRPGSQMTLLYQRQDSDLTFSSSGVGTVSEPFAVEYYQIGGIGGLPRDNVFPFTGLSIGATRLIDKDASNDVWKFSLIIRLGAKFYLSERVGLQLQGRLPWTVTNGGVGIGIGTGGAGVTFGGSGVAQIDLSGGLVINM